MAGPKGSATSAGNTKAAKSNKGGDRKGPFSKKNKSLRIEAAPLSATGAPCPSVPGSTTPRAVTQDQHPYARGSVIEVWHIPKTSDKSGGDDEWPWTESESEDENPTEATTKQDSKKGSRSIRLCDVIDRSPAAPWRYYVHYRDFNRRMDEWIAIDRIVSPPSVGNAKARQRKKEEKQHHKQQQKRKAEAEVELPRQSRRRSTDATNLPSLGRRGRRKSSKLVDDDATVVAANSNTGSNNAHNNSNSNLPQEDDDEENEFDGSEKEAPKAASTAALNKKEVLALPTEAVTTETVGGHVLATFNAVELDEHEGLDEQSLREHEEVTKVKNVAFLELGEFQMETWYFSPIPKELIGPSGYIPVLYVCEFTFRMFTRKSELLRYQRRLPVTDRHPPGDEIYRKGKVAMFEVDAQQEEIYCQNLSYIAKLFLDHKTLYFSVSPFLFYVLCEVDERGYHPVGYFSKEKYSDVGYNLACILTFPSHQRKGYGRFLIAFSYELSKKEEKVGSPEKPMSDLGQQAYKPYWASTIIDFLLNESDQTSLSIMDVSKRTSIMAEDIVFTLNQLGLLKCINGVHFIAAEKKLLQGLAKKYPIKEPRIDPARLHWTPFLTDIKRDKFSIRSKKQSVSEPLPTS